ncbi:MAG: amino acid carrier protein [Candidatus Babeliaceae bacterium]|jgi:AGCS family alanine or glycine:cation symporter
MILHTLEQSAHALNEFIWGWPLIIFVIATGIIMTCVLDFVQFRYFFRAWKFLLTPEKSDNQGKNYISPVQAFVNTLSSSVGNGSIAGMATAMHSGGPGAAFWIFIMGFINMAIRFAEVYASTSIIDKSSFGALRGGPMVYLKRVPGGFVLPYIYAFFCLMLTFIGGNIIQCNSMGLGIERMTHVNPYIISVGMFLLLLYIMLGGSQRIIAISDKIVPIKVGLFFIATGIVLIYHYQSLFGAVQIIIESAFTSKAIAGGIMGYAVQDAIRYGMARSLNATEAGLGTAAIFFGSTGSKNPMRDSIMSMLSTFISYHLVCTVLMIVFVASGVWTSGLTSTPLTIAAYETVFGQAGGWVVTFLSITFGLGVLVAYAYIGLENWLFLFKGKGRYIYTALYCAIAFFGPLGKVAILWDLNDIIIAGLIITNLYGLLFLLPTLRAGLKKYQKNEQ